jgi:hypothetical protein
MYQHVLYLAALPLGGATSLCNSNTQPQDVYCASEGSRFLHCEDVCFRRLQCTSYMTFAAASCRDAPAALCSELPRSVFLDALRTRPW